MRALRTGFVVPAGVVALTLLAGGVPAVAAPSQPAAASATANARPTGVPKAGCGEFGVNSSGPAVATIQTMVGVPADGEFGPQTAAALKAWQHRHHLRRTGVVGPATWAAMRQRIAWRACGERITAAVPGGQPLHCASLHRGDIGPAVAVLQAALGTAVDGGFGPDTERAVKRARRSHKLPVNPYVTAPLWSALGLDGTPACEPGSAATSGSGGSAGGGGSAGAGGSGSHKHLTRLDRRRLRIERRVAAVVAGLSGPAKTSDQLVSKALGFARSQLGKPYRYGAVGPRSYDCSGLTMAAYAAAAVSMPRVAADQYAAGPKVALSDVREGDLLFWGSDVTKPSTIYHTGIYVGDGRVLDAPHTGTNVQVQPLWSTDLMPKAVRPSAALRLPVRPGTTGPTVAALQAALNHHGFTLTVDGGDGASTTSAVKRWQRANGFRATGRVTKHQWPALGWLPRGTD